MKSTRTLAAELTRQGHKVGPDTVGNLLRSEGFSCRARTRGWRDAVPRPGRRSQHLGTQAGEHIEAGERGPARTGRRSPVRPARQGLTAQRDPVDYLGSRRNVRRVCRSLSVAMDASCIRGSCVGFGRIWKHIVVSAYTAGNTARSAWTGFVGGLVVFICVQSSRDDRRRSGSLYYWCSLHPHGRWRDSCSNWKYSSDPGSDRPG
jgi:Rhodopirellula transposase DDE domain